MTCYDRGRRVWFETSPCVTVEGTVHDMFIYDRMTFYVLRYQAGDEPAFVVRRPGQFSWERPHNRELELLNKMVNISPVLAPDFTIDDYNEGKPWPRRSE